MFNADFYPTNRATFELMQIDCSGKIILEPQAGAGDLVNFLKEYGAKEVLACEKNPDLAEIAKTKAKFIKSDFFQVNAQEISHVDMIVMNPPFSNGVKHILHAWEIAPEGAEIVSLVNSDNFVGYGSKATNELKQLIEYYGNKTELENCFSEAKRKTNVDVALIKLYKPKTAENEFDGFFMDEDPKEDNVTQGIIPYSHVRDVVQRYVASIKCFEEHRLIADKMNNLTSIFDVGGFTFTIGHQNTVCDKEDFKKELQKKAWKYLFDKMNISKYVTKGVMKDINKFVETEQTKPFTMKNIYRMFEIIVGTRQQTFNKALEDAINKFTQYTHENRYHVEGWKTNSGYLLNKKIIVPYMVERNFANDNKMSVKYNSNSEHLDDLMKVICALTGDNYDDYPQLYQSLRYRYKIYSNGKYKRCEDSEEDVKALKKEYYKEGKPFELEDSEAVFGKWISWGFFDIKGFKKGTLHLKFKDNKVWEKINRAYGKIKEFELPEKI